MSQAQLLPTVSPSSSLPPITYKGLPVVTTEMLAKAYGCKPQQIKQNFANNKERFAEGKHFYSLQNGELHDFRLQVENFDPQISLSPKARNLTLWLERGAARHAKMLNTDQAWDVFEMLEETFFRVVKPVEQPAAPSPLSKRTDPERKALTAIISTWVGMAPIHYANARAQVNAHFGVASVDALTIAQVKEAIQWVQGKIDELGKAKALPPSEMSENDIIDDAANKRLKRVLRDLHAMQEQCGGLIDEVRICLSPKGKNFFLPEKLDNTYKTLQHLNFAATAGVYMVRQALISAYHIGKGIEFC